MVPHGCEVWFEVPVRLPGHERAQFLDLAWARSYPESAKNELVLALEMEQADWGTKDDNAWWRPAEDELEKILSANAAAGVLVLSRDRSGCEPDREYVVRAVACINGALGGRRTGKKLLVVLLTPPLENNEGRCAAHGFIYDENGTNQELGTIDCWKGI
jgi:hypothetical protein